MKKVFLILALLLPFVPVFCQSNKNSDSFVEFLEKAKQRYEKRDMDGALAALESAQRVITAQSKSKAKGGTGYTTIKSWSTVQKKPADYDGVKIKIQALNYGITPDESLWIFGVSPMCSYEASIKQDLLQLEKNKKYYFYGTVVWLNPTIGPILHVETVAE